MTKEQLEALVERWRECVEAEILGCLTSIPDGYEVSGGAVIKKQSDLQPSRFSLVNLDAGV